MAEAGLAPLGSHALAGIHAHVVRDIAQYVTEIGQCDICERAFGDLTKHFKSVQHWTALRSRFQFAPADKFDDWSSAENIVFV